MLSQADMIELSSLAPVFLTITVIELALGVYILRKGFGSPVNRLFFWFSLLAAVGNMLDLLMASLTVESLAAWTYRVLIFLLIIELGVAYRLSALVPYDSGLVVLRKNSKAFAPLVTIAAFLMTLTVWDLNRDSYGWTSDVPLTSVGLIFCMIVYMVLLTITLRRKMARLDKKGLRQAELLTFALAFPISVMVIIMAMTEVGVVIPRMFGLGEVVSVIVLSYGIMRYDLMVPPRVTEAVTMATRALPTLEGGRAYLFEARTPETMFLAMLSKMSKEFSVLVVSRTHPEQLRAAYRLTQTPFLWLAETPGPNNINPGNLQLLAHMTTEFVRKGPSLVVIDGLEYLLVNNDPNRIMKFLGQLRDEVIVKGSILLVSIDPRALTERQRAILEREMDMVIRI